MPNRPALIFLLLNWNWSLLIMKISLFYCLTLLNVFNSKMLTKMYARLPLSPLTPPFPFPSSPLSLPLFPFFSSFPLCILFPLLVPLSPLPFSFLPSSLFLLLLSRLLSPLPFPYSLPLYLFRSPLPLFSPFPPFLLSYLFLFPST